MASSIDPSLPPSDHLVEVVDQTSFQSFNVRGSVPRAVSGRLLGVFDGVVHSVHLRGGRVLSNRSRRVRSEDGTVDTTSHIFVFGGSILAFDAGLLARELSPDLDVARPVDLAGRGQALSACPRHDPTTGDLHLLAAGSDGSQAQVVVSSGALMRRSRPIIDPPNPVDDLAIAGDHVVFASRGFIGIGSRDLESRVQWIPTGVDAPALVHAHCTDDTVVVYAVTPLLERWTIHLASSSVHREVLDPTPQRFARITDIGEMARHLLCTIGDRTADTYDLVAGRHVHRNFGQRQPGDLVFVADPARPDVTVGGWLVGFVHDESGLAADLVMLDAADISRPAVAVVHISQPIPTDLHTTWIPETNPQPHQGDRP